MMKSNRLLILAALFCLALSTTYAVHQTKDTRAAVALQAAMKKETVDGDLKSAIEQYKKIISNYKDNRSVVAQALVRLGGCYERLGDKDARAAYQRVVTEFADQQPSAGKARARLTALPGTKPVSQGPLFRQIGTIPIFGSPSPDGRLFVYWNYTASTLWIQNLATGAEQKLNVDRADDAAFWSPDGTMLAYNILGSNKICIFKINGMESSDAKIVFEAEKDDTAFHLIGWMPDGNSLLAYSTKSGKLAQISLENGSAKTLRSIPGLRAPRAMISPDGKYLAYESFTNGTAGNIFVLSLFGESNFQLFPETRQCVLLGWDSEGQSLVFGGNLSGSFDLWRGQVRDGKPVGEFERLRSDVDELEPLGSTRNGSFYFNINRRYTTLSISELDIANGKIGKSIATINSGQANLFHSAVWSPNGERLAYLAAANQNESLNYSVLGIWSIRNGREAENKISIPLYSFPLTWSGDGKWIYGKSYSPGNVMLCRVDPTTGKTEVLLTTGDNFIGYSSEGKAVAIKRDATSKQGLLYTVNIADRLQTELFRSQQGYIVLPYEPVSPDGKWCCRS